MTLRLPRLRPAILAALLSCAAAARADPGTWTFEYTGFYSEPDQAYVPGLVLAGSFTGEDRNRDTVLDLSEISAFVIGGVQVLPCVYPADELTHSCSLSRFSWSAAGGLDFAAQTVAEYAPSTEFFTNRYISGDRFSFGYAHARGGFSSEDVYRWTPQTTFSILSPVPEPGGLAMAAAGLALIGGLRLRRRL
jgi:hypothetical protein